MRLFAVKVLRLIVVVLVVTFFSFWFIKLHPGNDLVDKIIPFGTEAQKDVLRAGPRAQRRRSSSSTGTGSATSSPATSATTTCRTRRPVSDVVEKRLPVSLELMLYAQVLSLRHRDPVRHPHRVQGGHPLRRASRTRWRSRCSRSRTSSLALLLAIYVGAKWQLLPTQSNVCRRSRSTRSTTGATC